jgi:hypothetical protein
MRPDFVRLVVRACLCWFYDLGSIPLVSLFSGYHGRKYLLRNGIRGGDARTGLPLVSRQIGGIREALTVTTSLILYFGALLVPAISNLGVNAA